MALMLTWLFMWRALLAFGFDAVDGVDDDEDTADEVDSDGCRSPM